MRRQGSEALRISTAAKGTPLPEVRRRLAATGKRFGFEHLGTRETGVLSILRLAADASELFQRMPRNRE
jgi:hypothetical protein